MAKLTVQPNNKPTRKVAGGGVGASVSIVIIWLAGQFGLEVSAEVASAFTAVIAFAVSWFVKDRA